MLQINSKLFYFLLAPALLLLVPLIAMQFTTEVNWTFMDFLVAAILFFGTSMACAIILQKVRSQITRIAILGGVSLCLAWVWTQLAVGLVNV